jgi:hypothetical protein
MSDNSQLIKEISETIIEKYGPDKIVLIDNQNILGNNSNSDIELLVVMDIPKEKFYKQRTDLQLLFAGLAAENGIEIDFLVCNTEMVEKRIEMGDLFIGNIYHEGNILYSKELVSERAGGTHDWQVLDDGR